MTDAPSSGGPAADEPAEASAPVEDQPVAAADDEAVDATGAAGDAAGDAAIESVAAPGDAPVDAQVDALAMGEGDPTRLTPPDHPTFVVMEVVHVVFELPSPSPLLVLREAASPYRALEFPIGLPEAQSIAMAIAHERPPRPGAHELLVEVLRAAACDVIAVRLTKERSGTIHAELDVQGPRGRDVLDCRPTDGIAVALRLPVPAPVLAEVGLLEG